VATEQQIIDRVRRQIADYTPSQIYENEFYEDAIQFSLEKLSYDFDVTYNAVTDVPVNLP
jgi:hypothetical protein